MMTLSSVDRNCPELETSVCPQPNKLTCDGAIVAGGPGGVASVTVKFSPLLEAPSVLTTIGPDVAPGGTDTSMAVSLQ